MITKIVLPKSNPITSRVPPERACITIFNKARADILISLKKCGLKQRKTCYSIVPLNKTTTV